MQTGLLLMTIGLIFLLGQLYGGVLGMHRLWPVILLVLGLGKFIAPDEDPRKGGGRPGGVWLIVIGGVFLLNNFGVMTISDDVARVGIQIDA